MNMILVPLVIIALVLSVLAFIKAYKKPKAERFELPASTYTDPSYVDNPCVDECIRNNTVFPKLCPFQCLVNGPSVMSVSVGEPVLLEQK